MNESKRDPLIEALRWLAEGHEHDSAGTVSGHPGLQRVGADARNVAKGALAAVEASPEPMRCHTCAHFRVDPTMADFALEFQMGECAIKLGDVEFRIGCGSYCQGGSVAEVTVDALFGCRGWTDALQTETRD